LTRYATRPARGCGCVKRRKVLLAICRLAVVASCPTPRSPNQYLACLDACADAAQGRSRGTRHPCGRGACQCSIGDSGMRHAARAKHGRACQNPVRPGGAFPGEREEKSHSQGQTEPLLDTGMGRETQIGEHRQGRADDEREHRQLDALRQDIAIGERRHRAAGARRWSPRDRIPASWPRMSEAVTSGKVALPVYKTTTLG
jgi:hypothetical protein